MKLNLKEYRSRIDRKSWQLLRYRGTKKTKKRKALSVILRPLVLEIRWVVLNEIEHFMKSRLVELHQLVVPSNSLLCSLSCRRQQRLQGEMSKRQTSQSAEKVDLREDS